MHLLVGWWLSAAAVIWVVVKLPQEYWLHVAQLDVTEEISRHRWLIGLLIVIVLGLALAFQKLVRPPAVAAGLVVAVPARAAARRRSTSPRSRTPGGCGTTRSSPPAPSRR